MPMPMANISAPLETRLVAVERGVNALLTAMSLVVDTLQQQTNLLGELATSAKEPTEGSPVVEAIDTLTGAVLKMGEGIEALSEPRRDFRRLQFLRRWSHDREHREEVCTGSPRSSGQDGV
jgi:hypothetical protein